MNFTLTNRLHNMYILESWWKLTEVQIEPVSHKHITRYGQYSAFRYEIQYLLAGN